MLFVGGCGTHSSDYTLYSLNASFKDQPINKFFYVYGVPTEEFDLAKGNKVYRWASVLPSTVASTTHSDFYYVSYITDSATYHVTDNYRGSTERQYCELRIYTDKNDIVQDFAIAVDTYGKWSRSRCSEIFNVVYP